MQDPRDNLESVSVLECADYIDRLHQYIDLLKSSQNAVADSEIKSLTDRLAVQSIYYREQIQKERERTAIADEISRQFAEECEALRVSNGTRRLQDEIHELKRHQHKWRSWSERPSTPGKYLSLWHKFTKSGNEIDECVVATWDGEKWLGAVPLKRYLYAWSWLPEMFPCAKED